jgi:enoyl-CoA hydratase/carnithine racemase
MQVGLRDGRLLPCPGLPRNNLRMGNGSSTLGIQPVDHAGPVRFLAADGVARLTLARPKRHNTLSDAMIAALDDALERCAADPTVRAIVIAAEGPTFSAGHDMKEMTTRRTDTDGGRAYFTDLMQRCSRLMMKIVALPKPVIAAVEGMATAAGCQLVASCDLAIAGADAKFATPGVNIGLFCSTPMVALTRNVASKHAMEMLLLGERIDAADAMRMGLVNRVVPAGQAAETALAWAQRIAGKSALTVKTGKRAFYRQRAMNLEEAYQYAAAVMTENLLAADAEEGICAFLEKRLPNWRDS